MRRFSPCRDIPVRVRRRIVILSDKTYDILKWVVMLALPALATLISTVGKIWGIDLAPQISETVVAINAALAMVLGISTISYNKT